MAGIQGFAYVEFVIDAFAGRIVGRRVSPTARAAFMLDTLEQALSERRPARCGSLVHHSDRGAQYVSIRYTERLLEAVIEAPVGSVGGKYDKTLAETIDGQFKTEVNHRRGSWRTIEAIGFGILKWVHWFNNHRLLEPIGNIPPAEAEAHNYSQPQGTPWYRDANKWAFDKPGALEVGRFQSDKTPRILSAKTRQHSGSPVFRHYRQHPSAPRALD